MWQDEKFDLVQEASRCDRAYNTKRRKPNKPDHVERVFIRLMLLGMVQAAMRWLNPKDQHISVFDALKSKHPNSHHPHSSTLLKASTLHILEDIEITGAHVGIIAWRIQGSEGPGRCDALHWQDILCRYGSYSRRLCDTVADLSRTLL